MRTWNRADISIEDSRFDYWFPAAPWENLGAAAQLYGLGMIALAGGIASPRVRGDLEPHVAAGYASSRPRRPHCSASMPWCLSDGSPSALGFTPVEILLGMAQAAGLIVLALVCGPRSAGSAVAPCSCSARRRSATWCRRSESRRRS